MPASDQAPLSERLYQKSIDAVKFVKPIAHVGWIPVLLWLGCRNENLNIFEVLKPPL